MNYRTLIILILCIAAVAIAGCTSTQSGVAEIRRIAGPGIR